MAVSSRYLKYQTLKGGVVESWSVELPFAIIRLEPAFPCSYRRFGRFDQLNRSHPFACVPLKPAYYRGAVMGIVLFGG